MTITEYIHCVSFLYIICVNFSCDVDRVNENIQQILLGMQDQTDTQLTKIKELKKCT